MKDVLIVSADTWYTSANGRNYILVSNEALYIKEMHPTMINPNQCRNFGAAVQDNPYYADKPIAISSPDSEVTAWIQPKGIIVFLDTWYLSQKYLEAHQHIEITSLHHWNPHQIHFLQTKYGVQEEIEGRNMSATLICFSKGAPPEVGDNLAAKRGKEVIFYDINDFNRRLISSIRVTEEGAFNTNIWEKKRKREIVSAAKTIDNIKQKKI